MSVFISQVKSWVARNWEAATDTPSSSMSPEMFLSPLNIRLLPGTMHTLDSEYGFHPPLLSLTQPEAIAMVPVCGSPDLNTNPLTAEPSHLLAPVVHARGSD